MLVMSTNSTLKEFRILVHTLKGERKRQIKGVRVDVYEKNKKHDKVWGTLQKSLGQAAKMWWQLECQTDSLRSAYVTVHVFVWVQPSIHACQGRKLNHIHTQLQEVWFSHTLKSYFFQQLRFKWTSGFNPFYKENKKKRLFYINSCIH